MTTDKDEPATERNPRYIRWQALTLEQMGATTNMLLGLSTGLLALVFTFMVNDDKPLVASVAMVEVVLWSLAVSIMSAVLGSLSRLHDFRGTRNIASGLLNKEEKRATRKCVRTLGVITWALLTIQLGSFALGAGLSTVMIFKAWQPPPEQGQKVQK